MISLFRQETTKAILIEDNGDYILDHICINGIITEELNGEYSLDIDFRIIPTLNPEIYELLCEGSLLKVDDEYGKEYFRIAKVIKTTKRITVFARHISISDTLTMFCEDVRPENQTGTGALRWIFDNAKGVNWFNVSSDITVSNTAYYVNKNVYEALFTVDNCFLKRWGGEVYRRGFDIRINQLVGADRGVTIRSRKNLKGFEATTNIDYLKTRIYPKGYGGITIEEKYIDSPLINSYARVYSKEIKFEDVRVNDDTYKEGYPTLAAAQKELKRRVNELYEIDKVDIIPANYRIDFVELGKTEEYKNYSILEKTWLGDTVEVIEDTLKINISVRVLKRQYDIKKKKRINTELSNKDVKEKPPTIKDIIDMVDRLPNAENMLQIARDEATALINAGINGYVVANKNEILIMDTEDKNTAVKVWRFNVNGLAFSPTGYYGTYETALTMDGKLVLNSVTCEGINALLINAGVLKSINNKTWINLQDGTFNFANRIVFNGNNLNINLDSGETIEDTIKNVENNVTFKFGQSGGSNLLRNSSGHKGNTDFWELYNYGGGQLAIDTPSNYDWLGREKGFHIYFRDMISSTFRLQQNVGKLVLGRKYSLSGYLAGHSSKKRVFVWDGVNELASTEEYKHIYGGLVETDWVKFEITFTATGSDNVWVMIDGRNESANQDGYVWLKKLMLNDGEVKKAWSPHSEEIYNTSATMDKNGVTVKNGAFKILNNANEEVFKADDSGNMVASKITLVRPDGVKWVESGVAKFDFNAEACEPAATHQSIGIQQGFWLCYGAQTPGQYLACQYYTIKHTGRYLKVTVIRGLLNGNGWGNVRVRTPENNVLVSETFTNLVTDTNNYTTTLTVDLGAPTYTTRGFYIELAVSRADNNAYLRKLRMWQEG